MRKGEREFYDEMSGEKPFGIGLWSVHRMRDAKALCWSSLSFSPPALQVLILPLLARLRFFVTPVALLSGESMMKRTPS
jgi:hypothetical protein